MSKLIKEFLKSSKKKVDNLVHLEINDFGSVYDVIHYLHIGCKTLKFVKVSIFQMDDIPLYYYPNLVTCSLNFVNFQPLDNFPVLTKLIDDTSAPRALTINGHVQTSNCEEVWWLIRCNRVKIEVAMYLWLGLTRQGFQKDAKKLIVDQIVYGTSAKDWKMVANIKSPGLKLVPRTPEEVRIIDQIRQNQVNILKIEETIRKKEFANRADQERHDHMDAVITRKIELNNERLKRIEKREREIEVEEKKRLKGKEKIMKLVGKIQ